MNGRYAHCVTCGAVGHSRRRCPLRKLEEMRDPFGKKARPSPAESFDDPAVREATVFTVFLPGRALRLGR